jgi:hypothetical protein
MGWPAAQSSNGNPETVRDMQLANRNARVDLERYGLRSEWTKNSPTMQEVGWPTRSLSNARNGLERLGFRWEGRTSSSTTVFCSRQDPLERLKNPLHTALLRLRRKMYHVDYTAYVY